MNFSRPLFAALLFIGAAACAREAHPKAYEGLEGLWTHLLFEGGPVEHRRLPTSYPSTWAFKDRFEAKLGAVADAGKPLVLDIEKVQKRGGRAMLLDSTVNTPQEIRADIKFMKDKILAARAHGIRVGLWSRPSQNGLSHIHRQSQSKLRAVYAQRYRDALPVIAAQDFLCVQLYFPKPFKKIADAQWPIKHTIERGEWFLREHEKWGKASILFISPCWGGSGTADVPGGWLKAVTEHFVARSESICIWGGLNHEWDMGNPTCEAVDELMKAARDRRTVRN